MKSNMKHTILVIMYCTIISLLNCCEKNQPLGKITYPETFESSINILVDSSFIVKSDIVYSIAAHLPKGTSIKVHCKPSDGNDWGALGFFGSALIGFEFLNYMPDSVVLSADGNNETVSCPAMFGSGGPTDAQTSIDFFIYENRSTSPTRLKTVRDY